MRSAVVISCCVLWAGCFYIDPINQRPSLDIRQDEVGPVFRGEDVSFTAVVVDPDDHDVQLTWRAYMCTDAADANTCDETPLFTEILPTFSFTVPMLRVTGMPVESMRIVLDGKDDHGATAKPTDILQLDVLDRNPRVEMRKVSVYEQAGPQYVVGMPIDLFAKYTDGDDGLDTLTVDWKVFAPMQVPINLVDKQVEQTEAPEWRDVGKIFTPQITGEWTVELTVTDPLGNSDKKMLVFNVVADRAPCISVVAPIVPPSPNVLPVMEPTLFQVPIVSDDLDSYPKSIGGALFGEPTWVWSILVPGNGRQVISGANGSSTLFDPAAFTPGTVIELRVEIQDRKSTPVNCTDADPTCSTGGTSSCIQRQTWKVEAR